MLCSMAYFLARATASACSDDRRGSVPPRIAGSVEHLAPGPAVGSAVNIPVGRHSHRSRLGLPGVQIKLDIVTLFECVSGQIKRCSAFRLAINI